MDLRQASEERLKSPESQEKNREQRDRGTKSGPVGNKLPLCRAEKGLS